MSTPTLYSILNSTPTEKPTLNAIEAHRRNVSPSSIETSSSNSNSSLNHFNSLNQPNSNTSTNCSSASSTSSTHSLTASKYSMRNSATSFSSTSTNQRDIIRRSSVTPTHQNQLYSLHSLEPKPLRPFKSSDAYLEAMKEDLAEWLNRLYGDLDLTSDNFFTQLETGAIICHHANNVTQMGRNAMLEQRATSESSSNESSLIEASNYSLSSLSPDHSERLLQTNRPHGLQSNPSDSFSEQRLQRQQQQQQRNQSPTASLSSNSFRSSRRIDWFRVKTIPFKPDARSGTFFARDNICQFILWCRSLKIHDCLLFETDDLVARKNERSFILCLLEVARIGFKVGMPTPLIIQLEHEIDKEIENDAKLQLERQTALPKDDAIDSHHPPIDNFDCNANQDTQSTSTDNEGKRDDTSDQGVGNDDEYSEEDYGPKPQVITNDLLSLHERVVQLLCQCTCPTQFPMVRIGDGKYKVGDKLIIFVRILRRHIMVRVGGGWQELSEFLRQKDPCRTKQNSGQTCFSHHNDEQPKSIRSVSGIPRSRFIGSSHQLNKNFRGNSSGQKLISGSASMSWLSQN